VKQLRPIDIDLEVNAVIELNRRSFAESANDILRRLLVENGQSSALREERRASPRLGALPGERSTGRWTVEVEGRKEPAANLKGAYRTLLLLLHERDPDFLSAFSEQRARARRFVARSPDALYLASPGLAKHHAKPLAEGWFFDTNLSTDQVARRARIAARLAGLRYGGEVRILNNLEEI
jgi:negative regulator of replication initiation